MTTLLTPPQTAKRLNITTWTLTKWRTKGQGPPFVKVGRAVRYREADLDKWIQELPAHTSTAA